MSKKLLVFPIVACFIVLLGSSFTDGKDTPAKIEKALYKIKTRIIGYHKIIPILPLGEQSEYCEVRLNFKNIFNAQAYGFAIDGQGRIATVYHLLGSERVREKYCEETKGTKEANPKRIDVVYRLFGSNGQFYFGRSTLRLSKGFSLCDVKAKYHYQQESNTSAFIEFASQKDDLVIIKAAVEKNNSTNYLHLKNQRAGRREIAVYYLNGLSIKDQPANEPSVGEQQHSPPPPQQIYRGFLSTSPYLVFADNRFYKSYVLIARVFLGASGSPVVNTSGEVLGMIVAKHIKTQFGLVQPAKMIIDSLASH